MPLSHEQLRATAVAAGVGFWRWDIAEHVVALDVTLESLYGLQPGDFGGTFEAWMASIHPDDLPVVQCELDAAIAERRPHRFRHRIAGDGPERWLEARGDVRLDGDRVVGTNGCAWDITEQVEIDRQRNDAMRALEAAAERDAITKERFEFLSMIDDALSPPDPVEATRNAVEVAVPRLGDWCAMFIVDPGDGAVRVELAHSDPDVLGHVRGLLDRRPIDLDEQGVLADVIRTGSTILVPVIDDTALAALNDRRREFVAELGLRSAIIVPIHGLAGTIGALAVANSTANRTFGTDDVILAHALADRVGDTLENLQLVADLERDEFRAALDSLMDHVTIARAVRDGEGSIVDFRIEFMNAASIDGAGRCGEQLVGASVREMYPHLVESGLFDSYVHVTDSRRPLVIDRLRYDDVAPDGTNIAGWWSLRVVPFRDGYLATSRDDTEEVLAEQQLREAQREQERTFYAMRALQATALPKRLPIEPRLTFAVRYEPANESLPVGGDWYDAFVVPERGIGVVIADVAGHGMEAAEMMLRIRNVLRAYAIEGAEPSEVLSRTNNLLALNPSGYPFVTCTYALLDVDAESMSWSSAGHLAPVRCRSGEARALPGDVGPPLGVHAVAAYVSSVESLVDGDLIVWFTDGLVERRDEPIDVSLVGFAAAIEDLADAEPQALVDELLRRRSDGGALDDDAAVVAVRFEPRRPAPNHR